MASFAPTLIAPAPCRPIPLVRNRHHAHHHSRYQRLSSSNIITTPPIAASSSSTSASPLYHPYSPSSASAAAAAAASLASAFVFPNRPSASAGTGSGRHSSSAGRHSRPGSLSPDYHNKENGGSVSLTSAFLTAASPPSVLSSLPEKPHGDDDLSSSTDTVIIDHDLTPTRRLMQSFSASMNNGSDNEPSGSTRNDATPQQRQHEQDPSRSADPKRISLSFLEVPASASSLHTLTSSAQTNNSSPALSDSHPFSRNPTTTPPPSSSALGENMISNTPLHPSLIPPSPIPRRLTRNPFARSLSQGGYGLGVGGNGSGESLGSHPAPPPAPMRSASEYTYPTHDASLIINEPVSRFSLDTIGIGLMDLEFDSLLNMAADDGGRELLRVERERRKRSFEMHD
ncbi:unnamed protein product [Tilletia laevis]|uniref:Uncharacterized protein n=2 Tax=Tilletia TaxID=13289 RepID=A0A177VAS8_9BASI|nr:hypothetical protein CF336_g8310 [Tilletia laevis]KAE8243423.1 hypothetical protein A4X03_0g7770 [Tilletia caries]CAD6899809.1 unnamed protein product [Tilletia controversa]KAE8183942.1 hypothetical protein CF335_g8171 [Tilletia laevis]CAD6890394.1 unnamed protein product [Tilletia caries]